MRLFEFEQWLRETLISMDHDEIVSVESKAKGEIFSEVNPGQKVHNNSLQTIRHANGAVSQVQVVAVRGPGIPSHDAYVIPKAAW